MTSAEYLVEMDDAWSTLRRGGTRSCSTPTGAFPTIATWLPISATIRTTRLPPPLPRLRVHRDGTEASTTPERSGAGCAPSRHVRCTIVSAASASGGDRSSGSRMLAYVQAIERLGSRARRCSRISSSPQTGGEPLRRRPSRERRRLGRETKRGHAVLRSRSSCSAPIFRRLNARFGWRSDPLSARLDIDRMRSSRPTGADAGGQLRARHGGPLTKPRISRQSRRRSSPDVRPSAWIIVDDLQRRHGRPSRLSSPRSTRGSCWCTPGAGEGLREGLREGRACSLSNRG